jgi:hypothetical protein
MVQAIMLQKLLIINYLVIVCMIILAESYDDVLAGNGRIDQSIALVLI